MHYQGMSDGLLWFLCGAGLLLIATAAFAIWSAGRAAGRDDELLERTTPPKHEQQ